MEQAFGILLWGLIGAVAGLVVAFLFLPVLFVVAVKIMDYLEEKFNA